LAVTTATGTRAACRIGEQNSSINIGKEIAKAWDKSAHAYREDLKAMCALVSDEKTDLFAKIPYGDGQTVLREALLVADHNAYHLGQMVLLRRLLGAWK